MIQVGVPHVHQFVPFHRGTAPGYRRREALEQPAILAPPPKLGKECPAILISKGVVQVRMFNEFPTHSVPVQNLDKCRPEPGRPDLRSEKGRDYLTLYD